MATSQNGWPALTAAPSATLDWITGRVLPGDVFTIFDYLGRRFNDEVELINPAQSWGWAYRDIRGSSTTLSNHASGTAVDFNAPKHPLGATGTFTAAQTAQIRRILGDLDGVVRWGGDYSGRKDPMHFEINANAVKVAFVAKKIKGELPAPVTVPTTTITHTRLGAKMPALNLINPMTGLAVKRLQALLVANGFPPTGGIDGKGGQHTKAAVIAYQKAKGLKPDAIVGSATWNSLLGL